VTRGLISIEDSDLARAWVRALTVLCDPGVEEVSPMVVSVVGAGEAALTGNPAVECAIDVALAAAGKFPSHTVANTIFPVNLWNPAAPGAQLFDRYRALWPRLKHVPQNRLGTYFERLIAYDANGHNQLERIISMYRKGIRRRSALQASVFDPLRDQMATRRRGFPCLHQVAFLPIGADGLAVTAFYATQYIFDRAYGNYLGLARLGAFVAHETNRRLQQVVCIAAVARLGEEVSMGSARALRDEVGPLVALAAPIAGAAQSMEGGVS